MLNYEDFKKEFERVFLEITPEEEKGNVRFSSIKRINEERDSVGICDSFGAYKGGPCLYIRDIYQHYLDGNSVEKEAESVRKALKNATEKDFKMPDFSWDFVKEHVVLQLISKKENEAFLKEIAHRDYLDLAVVYRCVLDRNHNSTMSCLITNGLLQHMGITEEELYEAAYHMTPVTLIPRISTMYEVCHDMMKCMPETSGEELAAAMDRLIFAKMWVISDTIKQMGAYLLLYPEVFRGLTETEEDIYIIPSSVHELIALPVSVGEDAEAITAMIHEVNCNEVAADEVLSYSLYKYNAKDNKIEIV